MADNNIQDDQVKDDIQSLEDPASIPQKRSKKKLIIGLGIAAVLAGVVAYVIIRNNQSSVSEDASTSEATSQTKQPASAEELFAAIKADAANLNPSATEASQDVAVNLYTSGGSDVTTVSLTSDLYLEFANRNALGAKEDYTKLFADNGLTDHTTIYQSKETEDHDYKNDLAACALRVSVYFGRVNCVTSERLSAATKAGSEAAAALTSRFAKGSLDTYDFLYKTSADGTVQGGTIVAKNMKPYSPVQYVINTGNGWKFVAQDAKGIQDYIQPPCNLINKAQYKDVLTSLAPDCSK